jgi:hypothetical protein
MDGLSSLGRLFPLPSRRLVHHPFTASRNHLIPLIAPASTAPMRTVYITI